MNNNFFTSGDFEIDEIRREVLCSKTNSDNYTRRRAFVKYWIAAMQQQGVNAESLLDIMIYNLEFTPPSECYDRIDRAFARCETLQKELSNGNAEKAFASGSTQEPLLDCTNAENWCFFQKNLSHTASNPDLGPQQGVEDWKFPAGVAWEASPLVHGDRIYVASPGARGVMLLLNAETGELIKRIKRQIKEPKIENYDNPGVPSAPVINDSEDFYVYEGPAIASTPALNGGEIALRQMGSRGNPGPSKSVIFYDLEKEEITRSIVVGHVDYRALYAPLCYDGDEVIVPYAIHDIEQLPPVHHCYDRVRCYGAREGELRWEFITGTTVCEPIVDEDNVYVATINGELFCIARKEDKNNTNGRLRWVYRADGGIYSKLCADRDSVYFGTANGVICRVDKKNGLAVYETKTESPSVFTPRLFSEPFVKGDRVFIGSANGNFYVLDKNNGEVIFSHECDDWIRSAPVSDGDICYVATFNGTVYRFDLSGDIKMTWSRSFGEHAVVSALKMSGRKLVYTDCDLCVIMVNEQGEQLAKHTLLQSTTIDGHRIFFDQILGGTYYQSKLVAADGVVYAGSAMRTLHALDAVSGKEYWRAELTGPLSAAVAIYEGKLYVGQQGGDDSFYCLDAKTGGVIWKQAVGWVWGSAMVADNRVFLPGIDGYAYCLCAETGAILWRVRTSKSTCTEPFVDGEHVYFGGWDRFLYKINVKTGDIVWRLFLNAGADSGAATIVGDRIFLPTGGSRAYRCLDKHTAEILWEYHFDNIANFNSSSAYSDGVVFIAIQHGDMMKSGVTLAPLIIALNAETGKEIWRTPGGSLTGSINDKKSVYFGSSSSPFITSVSIKDYSNGAPKIQWRYRYSGRMEESCPAIYAGRLYAYTTDGYIHCIK